MDETQDDKPYLTPAEVAKRMMVSPITVRGWSQRGLLEAEVTPGGHRRYHRDVVERFARTWNPTGNKGPIRILIVDDDHALVGFLCELLGDRDGQTVLETANDGFEAGHKVHTFGPDVVLLDLMMPGISGVEVCRRIKDIPGNSRIRILAMSGYLTPENEEELLAAGAERCFAKPLDTAQLLLTLGIRD
ncbi:response regulator [Rhodoferax sp. AJA081-3]|uniref:response regulator n=1 Tax=Rhodoferax sp. AJA081-3 TaxID=2752316 RepID=UPI001ADF7213|nr:response regulator [Rhodoferax sp. AJA081-3]QTN28975.1 response regulator [Rhodoferax sp. AJA081-3]